MCCSNGSTRRLTGCGTVGLQQCPGEPVVLGLEVHLPVVVAQREQVALAVVEELVAGGLIDLAGQVRQLVVAVEVHPEVLVAGLVALQQLLLDVRHARRRP